MFDVILQPRYRATAFVAEVSIVQFNLLVKHGSEAKAASATVAGGLEWVNQTLGLHLPVDVLGAHT